MKMDPLGNATAKNPRQSQAQPGAATKGILHVQEPSALTATDATSVGEPATPNLRASLDRPASELEILRSQLGGTSGNNHLRQNRQSVHPAVTMPAQEEESEAEEEELTKQQSPQDRWAKIRKHAAERAAQQSSHMHQMQQASSHPQSASFTPVSALHHQQHQSRPSFGDLQGQRLTTQQHMAAQQHQQPPMRQDQRDHDFAFQRQREIEAQQQQAMRAPEREQTNWSRTETRNDDGETSGEETIESRVARIKARVAELTGNMEPGRR